MTNQTKTNNLHDLIDPTFNKFNKFSSYHLKIKKTEHLFQSTTHEKCVNWSKEVFWCASKK